MTQHGVRSMLCACCRHGRIMRFTRQPGTPGSLQCNIQVKRQLSRINVTAASTLLYAAGHCATYLFGPSHAQTHDGLTVSERCA